MDKNTEKHLETAQDQLRLSLETTQEFFSMWTKNYQSTLSKLAQVPAFGPVREKQEKMMKSIPIYTNLYTTWIESNINFQSVLMEATKRTYDKTIDDVKSGNMCTPEKYKEFYKIWIDTYSDTFKEFMKSGHFASDMGKFMSIFMDFQQYNKETIEDNYLKPNNLPTKTEIDEINKELYTLKMMIKGLSKEIKESSKKGESTINIEHSEKIEHAKSPERVESTKSSVKVADIKSKLDNIIENGTTHVPGPKTQPTSSTPEKVESTKSSAKVADTKSKLDNIIESGTTHVPGPKTQPTSSAPGKVEAQHKKETSIK